MPNQAQGGAPASTAPRSVGLAACAALVVANMVGTGIFTSLGFQVGEIPSRPAIMALWTLGGILALCGALCYAELSAAVTRSGGEYHFLGQIYHPSLGFMAGVVSLVVGFAAPVALSAMAFGSYLHGVFPGVSPIAASTAVVIIVTLFHLRDLRLSSIFQILFTVLKIGLVLFLIAALFAAPGTASAAGEPWSSYLLTAPFAVSLMFTLYAYSGWNAATYILGEVRTPARIIPAALIAGTLLVMALYLGLNAAFLHVAPTALLAGQLNVAQVAAESVFGANGGRLVAAVIALGLISAISAMIWAGPRVAMVIGEDYPPPSAGWDSAIRREFPLSRLPFSPHSHCCSSLRRLSSKLWFTRSSPCLPAAFSPCSAWLSCVSAIPRFPGLSKFPFTPQPRWSSSRSAPSPWFTRPPAARLRRFAARSPY